MIVGLGVDLVELDRVERAVARWGGRLVAKLMDAAEADRLPPSGPARVLALAQAIALKESTSKAIGTGWSRGVRWRDVVVESLTPPRIQLRARASEVARGLGAPRGQVEGRLEIRGNLVLGAVHLHS